jgi:hypothetical protein
MNNIYCVVYGEAPSQGVSIYGVVNRRGAQSPSPKALPLAREGLGFTSCHVRRTGARKVCPDSIGSETGREEEEARDPERDLDESEE